MLGSSSSEREEGASGAARLAQEQAALRRVATLVAEQSPAEKLFARVAEEVAKLFGEKVDSAIVRFEPDKTARVLAIWGSQPAGGVYVGASMPIEGGSIFTRVYHERGPVRIDDYDAAGGVIAERARRHGVRTAIGCPIVVEGRIWGAMAVAGADASPFQPDGEQRISQFAELVATAIANAEARAEGQRLADEQAALRRVAMLVAAGAERTEIFEAVIAEVQTLLDASQVGLLRFEGPDEALVLAQNAKLAAVLEAGIRVPLDGESAVSRVYRTGRSARVGMPSQGEGTIAALARRHDVTASIAAPITIEGEVWGVVAAAWGPDQSPPAEAEGRLAEFAELIASAVANAEARAEIQRLAEEQAALRRVATLVTKAPSATEVFDAVIAEARELLDGAQAGLMRFENDREARILAREADGPVYTHPGTILPLEGDSVIIRVFRTGRPARINHLEEGGGPTAELVRRNNTAATVGAPITVDGAIWGALVVSWVPGYDPPAGTEERLAKFARLLDAALANTEARTEVQRLADEQAALRRVATLVAKGAAPNEVFDAVILEVAQLLRPAQVGLMRSEGGGRVTILAQRGQRVGTVRPGMRLALDGDSVTARVLRTGRSARLAHYDAAGGSIAAIATRNDVNVTVGAPVTVDGAPWGVITASWEGEDVPPDDAEARLADFAELLDTAIANADSRDRLTASRARVLSAGDEARRRVVRDLHDGAQQRLVHAILALKLTRRALEKDGDRERAEPLLDEALEQVEQGNFELRELAHGILPSVLTRGGLAAGVDTLVSRLELPVEVAVTDERVPAEIEASAYFLVAEALTNVVKHADAGRAWVRAEVVGGRLELEIGDDGRGGADPEGHGLVGLADRVAALGGQLWIESRAGEGTVLRAALPL